VVTPREDTPDRVLAGHLQLGEYGPWATFCGVLEDVNLQRQMVPAMLAPFSW
jgi:hypothetical protein